MPRRDNFPLFDGLRGIAAIAVVTYHAVYLPALFGDIGGDWWWRYVYHLDVAVPIFLGISGFLLYRPFAAARLSDRQVPDLRAYGWRRVMRIVPGYWFALTVLTLWFWWHPPGFEEVRSAEGALRFYLFGQIYSADTAIQGIGQAWTLGVEVLFYAGLALWAVLMARRRSTLQAELIGIGALVVASIAWKVIVLARIDPSDPASLPYILPLPTWIDHLAIGMLLAVLSVQVQLHPPKGRWLGVLERRPGLAWAGVAVAFLGLCWVTGPSGAADDPVTDRVYLARHLLEGVLVACLLAPAVFGDPAVGTVRRVLHSRALVYVGTISFSFYLFHYAVLDQMGAWAGRGPRGYGELGLWWLAALAGSVVLGTIGYRLVELPSMRLGRHLGHRRRERAKSVAAPADTAP